MGLWDCSGETRKRGPRPGSWPGPRPLSQLNGSGLQAMETRRGLGQVAIPRTQGVVESAARGDV